MMNVTMLLCDAATEAGGKLYILGGGWSQVAAAEAPLNLALAIKLGVPWDETPGSHSFKLALMNLDGELVENPDGDGIQAMGQMDVARPDGVKQGSDIDVPIAITFNGLRLPAGGYRWELEIDDEPAARVAFTVFAAPAA